MERSLHNSSNSLRRLVKLSRATTSSCYTLDQPLLQSYMTLGRRKSSLRASDARLASTFQIGRASCDLARWLLLQTLSDLAFGEGSIWYLVAYLGFLCGQTSNCEEKKCVFRQFRTNQSYLILSTYPFLEVNTSIFGLEHRGQRSETASSACILFSLVSQAQAMASKGSLDGRGMCWLAKLQP